MNEDPWKLLSYYNYNPSTFRVIVALGLALVGIWLSQTYEISADRDRATTPAVVAESNQAPAD